ncbi:MAG: hypothetical protein LUC41_09350 [Clostridiales bacterium]|nr:hypothetical protein [Clostridiales bacterium]
MSARWIVLIIVMAILVAAIIALYILSKRSEKKRDEQQKIIDETAQFYTVLIIDKKKLRMKDSGLPQNVIDQTPRYAKIAKVPCVKVKVGPKVMTMIADNDIFDLIPVKKEVKVKASGIYITDVRGVRAPLEKKEKKKGPFSRITDFAQGRTRK